jgi:hypothetical protein
MNRVNVSSNIEEDKLNINNILEKNSKIISNMKIFVETIDNIEKNVSNRIETNINYMKQLTDDINNNQKSFKLICGNLNV